MPKYELDGYISKKDNPDYIVKNLLKLAKTWVAENEHKDAQLTKKIHLTIDLEMTKEEILKEWQELIIALKEADKQHPFDGREGKSRYAVLNEAIKQLNSCDALWLSEQYSKWFEESIKPFIPDLP